MSRPSAATSGERLTDRRKRFARGGRTRSSRSSVGGRDCNGISLGGLRQDVRRAAVRPSRALAASVPRIRRKPTRSSARRNRPQGDDRICVRAATLGTDRRPSRQLLAARGRAQTRNARGSMEQVAGRHRRGTRTQRCARRADRRLDTVGAVRVRGDPLAPAPRLDHRCPYLRIGILLRARHECPLRVPLPWPGS